MKTSNYTNNSRIKGLAIKTFIFFLSAIAMSLISKAQLLNVASNTTLNVVSGTNVIVQGGVTIQSSASVDNSGTVKLTGDWTNNGNGLINSSPGTVELNGTSGQNVTGSSSTAFNNLTVNNSSGVTLGTNASVDGTLAFADGKVNTGSNTLSIGASATAISGATSSRYVNGNLQKSFSTNAGTQTFKYEMGDAVYAPSTLDIRNVSGTVSVAGYVATTDANESYGSGIDQSNKVDHYWFLNKTGGTFDNYDVTLDFTNTSNTGNSANYIMKKFDPNAWAATTSSVTGSTIKATNLPSFSDFEVGEPGFSTLNLKLFIQGYYIGSSQMNPVVYMEGVAGSTGAETDTILVLLHSTADTVTVVDSLKTILLTDGTTTPVVFPAAVNGNSYWLAIKHRNGVETWSPNPVAFTTTTNYDFSTLASKAYGSNQIQPEVSGPWAFYNGDLSHDQNVDLLDFPALDNDITAGAFGYYRTDLNGDGNTDLLDFPILDGNINQGVFSNHP